MSLSKSIRRCNRCICKVRHYNTQNAVPEKTCQDAVKMSVSSQLKNMSISQWRLLNQLRDYLNKSQHEKGMLFTLNKEWIALLQKLPSVYKEDELKSRDVESLTKQNRTQPPSKIEEAEGISPVKDTQNYNFPQVFADLKLKANTKQIKEVPDETTPKWKPNKDVISKTSISSRTKHVLSSVATAESIQSRVKRLEDLTSHLNQYPESKHQAIKEGAIRLLLRLRQETNDKTTLEAIREGFAILGYLDPLPGKGIRILSIDGGGIRGVLVIEMLKKLEELTGKKVYELFDYICGVSTGAILACVLGGQRKTLDEVSILYKEMSTKIFTQNAFWGTSSLVWSHAYYNTEMWEQLLKSGVGEIQLMKTSRSVNSPKIAAVSAVVNQARVVAYVFRNYSLPYKVQSQYLGGNQYQLWEAARASAAAPSYFEEFRLGDTLHQDGGILVNNPCAVAIHEAKQLWPESSLQCVISFGTGRYSPMEHQQNQTQIVKTNGSSSWKTKFLKILDSATDTEAVHTMLNDLLPGNVYYRFNPYLTEMVTMDEIRPEKLNQLEMDAEMYYRRNEEKFEDAARALTAPQTLSQRCRNWINLQRDLL